LSFDQSNGRDILGLWQFCAEPCDDVGSCCVEELGSRYQLLSCELLPDQFARDTQSGSGDMGQRLCTAQLGIRRSHGPCDRENRAIALKHHKAGILIGQPLQRCKRNQSIRADHN
jgi:hypothetical protein